MTVEAECAYCKERRDCYVTEGRANQLLCIVCIRVLAARGLRDKK